MKELSIEQKAKRYDEAIKMAQAKMEEAKVFDYDDEQTAHTIRLTTTDIFPELKESEDEKIRKRIIALVNAHGQGMYKDEMLTWLEKKGEQKSIWHNEDEEPKRGSLILLIMQSGKPIVAQIIESNHTFSHGERWAYIDDLLEKQNEQNPAWSEDDENHIQHISDFIMRNRVGDTDAIYRLEQDVNWLKSLKGRYTWKPSDEHWFDEDFPHPVVSEEKIQEVAKENGSEFRQEISVTGRNIDDVFRLDCVRSVVKGLDGQPLFILKDGQSAHVGDTLRENQAGRWTVKRGGA